MSEVRRRVTASNKEAPSSLHAAATSSSIASAGSSSLASAIVKGVIVFAVVLVVAVVAFLTYITGGLGGPRYQDIGANQKPRFSMDSDVEVVAELPSPPGNLAVSPTGRIFFTFHPNYDFKPNIAEWFPANKSYAPYPPTSAVPAGMIKSVLSVRIDPLGECLWILDFGNHGTSSPSIFAIALATNSLKLHFQMPSSVAGFGSFLNDFNISPDGRYLYIADTGFIANKPGLVIFDSHSLSARRVLSNHPSTRATYFTPHVLGHAERLFGVWPLRIHVDSIALDRKGQYLYYAPLIGGQMYRIATDVLRNEKLSEAQVSSAVEVYRTDISFSDGMTSDNAGNLYLTDFENSAINLIESQQNGSSAFVTLLRDSARLRWPDGFSWGPDDYLYFTCSALAVKVPGFTVPPFHIYRFKPGQFATSGQ